MEGSSPSEATEAGRRGAVYGEEARGGGRAATAGGKSGNGGGHRAAHLRGGVEEAHRHDGAHHRREDHAGKEEGGAGGDELSRAMEVRKALQSGGGSSERAGRTSAEITSSRIPIDRVVSGWRWRRRWGVRRASSAPRAAQRAGSTRGRHIRCGCGGAVTTPSLARASWAHGPALTAGLAIPLRLRGQTRRGCDPTCV